MCDNSRLEPTDKGLPEDSLPSPVSPTRDAKRPVSPEICINICINGPFPPIPLMHSCDGENYDVSFVTLKTIGRFHKQGKPVPYFGWQHLLETVLDSVGLSPERSNDT